MRTFIHPDRNGEGPFLWFPIPKESVPPGRLPMGVRYWAFTGGLPKKNTASLDLRLWGRKDLEALCTDRTLRFRLVPTKSKGFDEAIQNKLGSGYVETTSGLSLSDLSDFLMVADDTPHAFFNPNLHLGSDSLELILCRHHPPLFDHGFLENWRRSQLESTIPWE